MLGFACPNLFEATKISTPLFNINEKAIGWGFESLHAHREKSLIFMGDFLFKITSFRAYLVVFFIHYLSRFPNTRVNGLAGYPKGLSFFCKLLLPKQLLEFV